MSVVMEFSIDSAEFKLGEWLAAASDASFELERVIPTGEHILPFIWVTTDADVDGVLKGFEATLNESPAVKELFALDRIGNGALYRITWATPDGAFMDALASADATILEARSREGARWMFRVRFSDHDQLTVFHNAIAEHGIDVHIHRIYTFTEATDRRRQFDLTAEQRESLLLALRRGYFSTPSEVRLDELADELGISKQAVSNRLRLGTEKVLETTLLSSAVRDG